MSILNGKDISVLTEQKGIRQIPGEGFRRWFTDRDFDLIVWYDDSSGIIVGFQLCYDKQSDERCLTWRRDGSYSHNKVDDGEIPYSSKMTPVLVADGIFSKETVAEQFKAAAENIESELVDLVYRKLLGYQKSK